MFKSESWTTYWATQSRGDKIGFIILFPFLIIAYGISYVWQWYEHG